MRILYLITRGDTIAGAQRNVLDLATHFATTQEVTVASGAPEGPFATEVRRRGITFFPIGSLAPGSGADQAVRAAGTIDRLVMMTDPDLIHAHSTKAGLLARAVARRRRVPCVFTAHGWAFTAGTPPIHRVAGVTTEVVGRLAGGHVVTVSQRDYELGLRWRLVPPQRLHLIEYGIPDLADDPKPLPCGEVPHLLMTARFEAQKDHATLLVALHRVRDLAWKLSLAGDGPLLSRCQRMAAELGIANRIEFLGYVADVPRLLSESHMFLLITRYEGLPISIMEALRHGRAVLATNVGGIEQMVRDDETGFLVRRGDPSDLARVLRRVLPNGEFITRAGKRARELYEKEFTLERMVFDMGRLYKSLTP